MNQHQVYCPILENFCERNIDIMSTSGYPWAPFIPVAFSKYKDADPKIFYVGIDTYGWGVTMQQLINAYKTHALDEILIANDQIVTPSRILKDWYNNKGAFWSFVCKLHLYIRTGKFYTNEDLRHLSTLETELISEIGWGNMNSIELKETLKKEGIWDDVDSKKYRNLKASSKELINPIKNLIAAYSPDYIFILGWRDEEYTFKGMKAHDINEHYENGLRALYTLEDVSTKIIWSSHPTRYSFLRTNQNEMVPYLADSMRLF